MNSRFIDICDGKQIEIIQDLNFGYAGEVWDAALVLAYFMINKDKKHKITFENKIILELGSGTGITGLIASALGAKKVYLTDKEENLGILKKNYELNRNLIKDCDIMPLDWNKKEQWSMINDKIDIIICCEVIWNPDYFDSLIETIDYFTISNYTEIILCFQYRKKTDLDFINKIKEIKKWTLKKISNDSLDDEYKSDDIFILIIKK